MCQIKKKLKLAFKIGVAILILLLVIFIGLGVCTHEARGSGPVILMYHHLAPRGTYDSTAGVKNGAILSVEAFDEQMQWLQANDYQTLLMSEVATYFAKSKDFPDKTVILTFDDGYESNFVYAYPILQKYNLKANLAIVVRDTERREEYPDNSPYNPKSLRHLTFDEIVEMSDSGLVEIGSHSYDGHGDVNIDANGRTAPFFVNKKYDTINHVCETNLEYHERLIDDLAKSKTVLEAKLGKPVNYLAYPYGKVNQNVVDMANLVDFKIAVTTKKGFVNLESKPLELPRINIDSKMTIEDFAKLVVYSQH